MLFRWFGAILISFTLLSGSLPAFAQESDRPLSAAAKKRIERERARQIVEGAYETMWLSVEEGGERVQNLNIAADTLVENGESVFPFLLAELDADNKNTFTFVAFVLGRLGNKEAIPDLKRAAARADREAGEFAIARKAWALYAMGMLGDVEALTRLNRGEHVTSSETIHFAWNTMTGISYFNPVPARPLLYKFLNEWKGDERLNAKRFNVLEALREIPAPENLEPLRQALADEEVGLRRRAAIALMGVPGSADLLIKTLCEDESPLVRHAAGWTLQRTGQSYDTARLYERLNVEPDTGVRGELYQLIAAADGKKAIPALSEQWGLPAMNDRRVLLLSLGTLRTARTGDLLQRAITDDSTQVVLAALDALDSAGSERASSMLESVARNGKFVFANYALGLMRESMPAQAAEIVKLRLADQMSGPISDPQARDRVYLLAEHALQLGIRDLYPMLVEPAKIQRDGSLVAFLKEFMMQLELLHKSDSTSLEEWHTHALGDNPLLRMVAMRELVKLDSEAALAPVAELFFDLPPQDAAELLVRLSKSKSAAAKSIVANVLSDERSMDYRREAAVDAAAYAARKLADPALLESLHQHALNDTGRNAAVLIQLMLADSKRGLSAFEAVRLRRLTRLGATRGFEQRELEWVARLIRKGESLERWKVHPGKLRQLITP